MRIYMRDKKIVIYISDDLDINIESEEMQFRYANLKHTYKDGDAVGLQWEKVGDNPKLMTMCNKINDSICEFLRSKDNE
jgi:hypothetical protein